MAAASALGSPSPNLVGVCHALPAQAPFDYVFIWIPDGPGLDYYRNIPGDKVGVSSPADCKGTVANAGDPGLPSDLVGVCHALPDPAPFDWVFIFVSRSDLAAFQAENPNDKVGVSSPADCGGTVANAGAPGLPGDLVGVCHALPDPAPFDWVFIRVPASV